MPVVEISSLSHPGVEIFCTLTEAQLRNRIEPDKGIFIVESPKVIERALDAGYEPLAILCEHKHITGDASNIIERCGNVPVYTGSRELLATLTGYVLTRGVLCAMRRPAVRSMAEVCRESRRTVVQSEYRWERSSLYHGLGWTVLSATWASWASVQLPWHSRITLFPLMILSWQPNPDWLS